MQWSSWKKRNLLSVHAACLGISIENEFSASQPSEKGL